MSVKILPVEVGKQLHELAKYCMTHLKLGPHLYLWAGIFIATPSCQPFTNIRLIIASEFQQLNKITFFIVKFSQTPADQDVVYFASSSSTCDYLFSFVHYVPEKEHHQHYFVVCQ